MIACLIHFTLGMEYMSSEYTISAEYSLTAFSTHSSENYDSSLQADCELPSNENNQKQAIKSKKKSFSCCCGKTKPKKYTIQIQEEELPGLVHTKKIKPKSKRNQLPESAYIDQLRDSEEGFLSERNIRPKPVEHMRHSLKMDRKSSTQNVTSPKHKISAEKLKSAIFLSRKTSTQSVNTPIVLSRRLSEKSPSILSHYSSIETVKSGNPLSQQFEQKTYLQKEKGNVITPIMLSRHISAPQILSRESTKNSSSHKSTTETLTSAILLRRKSSAERKSYLEKESERISAPLPLSRRLTDESIKSALSYKSSEQNISSPKTLSQKISAESAKHFNNKSSGEGKEYLEKEKVQEKSFAERKLYLEEKKKRFSAPILLSRRITDESIKSALSLSRKSSAKTISSPKTLSRKSSAESVKSFNKKPSVKSKEYLENKTLVEIKEETSETDNKLHSFSSEDVLLYICLNENVEMCQKCKTLKYIFENKNSTKKYLLYNLPLRKLQNPNELDLENIPTWLELVLWSILAEKQNMNICVRITESQIGSTYQSKLTYLQLLKNYAQVKPHGGHIFFSILKSKFLGKDLKFFITNNIIKFDDTFIEIGDNEGSICKCISSFDQYENIFLLDGIMEEVKPDYEPEIGDRVASNENFHASNEDQFDFANGTQMLVEKIDPQDRSIFVTNTDWKQGQWISHETFINIAK